MPDNENGLTKNGLSIHPKTAEPPATFIINAWPNPAKAGFTLQVQSNSQHAISIRVYDVQGKQVQIIDRVVPNGFVRIGDSWKAGLYFAEIIQGDQRKKIKLIKVN